MSNLPFPGLDTLQKLRGWAEEQSGTLLRILENGPAAFLEQLQGSPDDQLAGAVKFFAFIFLICSLITIPLDYAIWHLDVTDVGTVLSAVIMSLIIWLLFSAVLHITARALRSKTDLKRGLTAIFFSMAYMPFLEATRYIEQVDPIGRKIALGEVPPEVVLVSMVTRPSLIAAAIIQILLILYIVYKLIGVFKITYGFGRLRSLITILIAGIIHSFFGTFIGNPIWAEFVKQASGR